MKVVGIDVDLTVVDMITPWLQWYNQETGENLTLDDLKGYEYHIQDLMTKHKNPLSFWEKEDLYDNLSPMPEVKKYIDNLSKYFKIVFISSCFPGHYKSKENFLKRYFSYADFIATHSKEYIDVDYFIDDYKKYIDAVYERSKQRGRITKCLKVKNPLSDGFEWEDIFDFIIQDSKCVV